MKIAIAAALGALAVAGAASAAPGDELAGNSLQVRFVGEAGGVSVLHFIPNQRVHMILRRGGRETQDIARWTVADGRICFDWQNLTDECWTYPAAMTAGQTVRSTLVGGTQAADVTLVAGLNTTPPDEHAGH